MGMDSGMHLLEEPVLSLPERSHRGVEFIVRFQRRQESIAGKTISGFMREVELAVNKIIFYVGFDTWKFESLALLSLQCSVNTGVYYNFRSCMEKLVLFSSTHHQNVFLGRPYKSLH